MRLSKIPGIVALFVVLMFASCSKDESTSTSYSQIYFMEAGLENMMSFSLKDSTLNTVIPGVYGAGLAYDNVHNTMYYSQFSSETESGKIWKYKPGASEAEAIVTDITDPYSVVVDPNGGKVYWSDDAGNISRCNLDGSSLETGFIHIDDAWMRGLALDLVNDKIYYIDANADIIYRADLDGTNQITLLENHYGYGIYVDTKESKLYINLISDGGGDIEYNGLYRTNLDGTNIQEIFSTESKIFGIQKDEYTSSLYFSVKDSSTIYKSNLNGTSLKEVVKITDSSPRALILK